VTGLQTIGGRGAHHSPLSGHTSVSSVQVIAQRLRVCRRGHCADPRRHNRPYAHNNKKAEADSGTRLRHARDTMHSVIWCFRIPPPLSHLHAAANAALALRTTPDL